MLYFSWRCCFYLRQYSFHLSFSRVLDVVGSYLGEVHVGDNDNVDGAGGILGGSAGITAGVVLVLALGRAALPRHAVLGKRDGALRSRRGGGAALKQKKKEVTYRC